MRSIRLLMQQLPILVLLAALALPSVGPLLDHHFAERQPGHLHIGSIGEHAHAYQHSHEHSHAGGDYATALYNHDSGLTAITTVIFFADSELDAFLDFEPGSLFLLPNPSQRIAKQNYIPPPGKPPQFHL